MPPSHTEEDSRCLRVFAEDPLNRFHRMSIVIAFLAGFLAVIYAWFPLPVFSMSLMAGLFVAMTFGSYLGRLKMLVIRPGDFFTVGGDADRAISWASVGSVESVDRGIEWVMRDGQKKRLRLTFLTAAERYPAVTEMIRYHETFQAFGPPRFPPSAEVQLATERLVIRPLWESDRENFTSLKRSPENMAFQLESRMSPEFDADWFDLTLTSMNEIGHWRFAIERDGEWIGQVALVLKDYILRHAHVGIDLLPEFWNRGYATEAMVAVFDFARRQTSLTKISAGCFADNLPCRRALEKAGMTWRGTFERFWIKDGVWKAGHQFELILPGPE